MVVLFAVRFVSLFLSLLFISHWLACALCTIAEWPEDPTTAEQLYTDEELVGWTFGGINAMDVQGGTMHPLVLRPENPKPSSLTKSMIS